MRAYGRTKTIRFPNKRDNHPKKYGKRFINWWEDIAKDLSRSRMKQIVKQEFIEKADE